MSETVQALLLSIRADSRVNPFDSPLPRFFSYTQVKFVLLREPRLPEKASNSLDFVILYDVLVHVDLHITNKYVREIARVLKPGGRAFLSTANFLSPGQRSGLFHSSYVLLVAAVMTQDAYLYCK